MSWWIKGKLAKHDRILLNHYPCSVYASAPDEDEEGVIKHAVDEVEYENPGQDLWIAYKLWGLIGSDTGKKLSKLIDEEIIVEANKVSELNETFDPDNDEPEEMFLTKHVIHQDHNRQMSVLLKTLPNEIKEITDENYQIKLDKLDYVLSKAPELVSSWTQESGAKYYTLVNSLSQAQGPEWFLGHALRLGRDIYWDDD